MPINYAVPTDIYGTRPLPPYLPAHDRRGTSSGLVHAVCDVKPAIVTGQSLRLHLLAAGLQLGPVRAPLRLHLPQLLHGQLRLGRLRVRWRSRGLRRRDREIARDERHDGTASTNAKHGRPPPLRILSCRTEQAVQESKAVGRASCASHQLSFLATRVLHAKRYTSLENALGIADQKILTALSKVFQTPQASGMPTNSQNNAAFASSPPLPMPNDPCWIAASLLALAACSLATSASLMCHLESTGLIMKLQIRPA